ncbi:MAG: hypothetical protein JKY02_02780 [Flavobacteriaceae bacterium]|nr:hypothetical protein [Flavobacteriaceae bacterium]
MANTDLLGKGFQRLLILLFLFIASPILLSISFKAIKNYKEGFPYFISIVSIVISSLLIIYTIYFAFKTFRILLDSLFSEKQ